MPSYTFRKGDGTTVTLDAADGEEAIAVLIDSKLIASPDDVSLEPGWTEPLPDRDFLVWSGPVTVHHLSDVRSIGPFPDPAAATRWLRSLPNALFRDAAELEHARGNGDVYLSALEDPWVASAELVPRVDYPEEWERSWDPGPELER